MPSYRFLQLDVFTDKAFAGNPLAVFPEAEGLSSEVMMQIARELNLSETVFVLKPHGDNENSVLRRLRMFKVLYYLTSLFMWRDTLRHRRELRELTAS